MNRKNMLRTLAMVLGLTMLLCSAAMAEGQATEPYPETVTITRTQMTTPISLWENGDTETNNPWTRLVKDKLNIDLVDLWSADDSQYETKMNIAIGSNTLPDVFAVTSAQLAQLVEAGMACDMSELYEQYASADLRKIMDADPIAADSGRFDGKLYGISKQHFGLIANVCYMWIRQDWLDNLGMTAPTTVEEFNALCDAVVNNDPDGNGQKDTYALGMDKNLGSFLYFSEAFHALPFIWHDDGNGQLVYGHVQPQMRAALQAAQEMFKRGYISPEFPVMDSSSLTADLISGKCGIRFTGSALEYSVGADLASTSGEKAFFKAYPIPSVDGEKVMTPIEFPVSGYVAVNADCKNPEAVIKMLNAFVDVQLNSDAETYAQFFNNERSWGNLPMSIYNPMADYNQGKYIPIALETGDTSNLDLSGLSKYEICKDYVENKTPSSYGTYFQVSGEGAYRIGVQVIDDGQYIYDAFRGMATPTMKDKKSTLDAMLTESFTKVIMGEDIASFDATVQKWMELGGADMTAEMNAAQ